MKPRIFAASFVMLSLILMSFTNIRNGPSGRAYAVTWQNDGGYWFAVGPTQVTWSGYKDEKKVIELVRGYQSKKHGKVTYKKTCGKFKVYDLGVDYNSYDTDAIKYVRKKGYTCDWPK